MIFNGKEKDENNEFSDLTHYDYGFRIYNPSIARFLSVDPLSREYPWYTPYQFAGNKPIWAIDLDGLEEAFATDFYDPNFKSIRRKLILNDNRTAKDEGTIQYNNKPGKPIEKASGKDKIKLDELRAMYRINDGSGNKPRVAGVMYDKPKPSKIITKPKVERKAEPKINVKKDKDVSIKLSTSMEIKTAPPPTPSLAPDTPTPSLAPDTPTPKIVELNLKGSAFDAKYATIDRPWWPQIGSDDITDLLAPAVDMLNNDPNAILTIIVGTNVSEGGKVAGPYETTVDLLEARFQEVVRQLLLVDPSLDQSRIKQKSEHNSKIEFKVTISTTY